MLLLSETLPDPSPPGPIYPKLYPDLDQDTLTESEKFTDGQPYQLFARLRAQAPVSWQREGSNVQFGRPVFRLEAASFLIARGDRMNRMPTQLLVF